MKVIISYILSLSNHVFLELCLGDELDECFFFSYGPDSFSLNFSRIVL